jgi:predicted dehydrogenase
MDEIRMGIVGLGARGSLGWIPLLQKIGGYRITAICDPVMALHEQALAQIKQPTEVKRYTRYEELLADPSVDAVGLTVRCEEQGELAALALEAGKHVNSEVPAAHRLADCWRIVAAQERTGKVYLLAEQVRHAGYVDGWRKLVAAGQLGQITYAEGQYFHYYVEKSFRNPQTGEFYSPHQLADHPEVEPTWLYYMPPIHYIVHDLSPLLKVLDDRVIEVVAMSTASPSAAHPQLISPDMQVALMKTSRGALLRMACSFAQPHPHRDYHWLQVVGTGGAVEWRRSANDKPKLWFDNAQMFDKAEVDWRYERSDAPVSARGSGHSDMDYYVHVAFREAVLHGQPLEFDVYKAMDTAAPAILAAESIAQNSKLLTTPDFRPSPTRPAGRLPDYLATP